MQLPIFSTIDRFLFQLIYGLSGNWDFLDQFMVFLTNYAQVVMGSILVAGILYALVDMWQASRKETIYQAKNKLEMGPLLVFALSLILLVVLPIAISDLLRETIDRSRPFVAMDLSPLIEEEVRASLPSNHAAGSFAIAGFFMVYARRWFTPVALVALIVGFSRIYIGTHYPVDILAGALLGLLPALTWYALKAKSFPGASHTTRDQRFRVYTKDRWHS